ncbi:hypothetical protein JCM10908_004212 [Rhodotorula pacifica]|uniref:DCN1-like protein n=1 Tax=Rhodotorula pacifica TaxID=1495444 RepID=UPI0031773A1E
MAPKRKADTAGQTASKPKKRSTAAKKDDSPAKSTRASSSSTAKASSSSKTKTKSTAASSSASTSKGKGRKQTTVYVDSDSDSEDDSDVVIESPKKGKGKKPPAPKSTSKSKGSTKDENNVKDSKKSAKAPSKAPKASSKSKAATAAYEPLDATSTPGDTTPVNNSKKPVSKPKPTKPLPFKEGFPLFFADYAEEGAPEKMGAEGIEQLFQDMSLSMDGSYPMLLAYKVKAPPGSFGSFLRSDFERAFEAEKIASPAQLSASLQQLYDQILDSDSDEADFRVFYSFLFAFIKSESSKTLPAEMAIPLWSISLAQRYELAQSFVEFAESQGSAFKAVSIDVWTQLLEFCQSVKPDLTGWSEEDAWPSTIDAFVEWKKAQSA